MWLKKKSNEHTIPEPPSPEPKDYNINLPPPILLPEDNPNLKKNMPITKTVENTFIPNKQETPLIISNDSHQDYILDEFKGDNNPINSQNENTKTKQDDEVIHFIDDSDQSNYEQITKLKSAVHLKKNLKEKKYDLFFIEKNNYIDIRNLIIETELYSKNTLEYLENHNSNNKEAIYVFQKTMENIQKKISFIDKTLFGE